MTAPLIPSNIATLNGLIYAALANLGFGSLSTIDERINTALLSLGIDSLAGLTDVHETSPAIWDFLRFNGTDWVNRKTVELPAQVLSASGALAIDRALGEVAIVTLTGNITSMSISNWGPSGTLSRLVLDIVNMSEHTIGAWPTNTLWDIAPEIGQRVLAVLLSVDGGTTVFANIVGSNYRTL
jgi:hypothetical protein